MKLQIKQFQGYKDLEMTKDINKEIFDDSTKLKLEIFGECFREWLPVFIHNPLIKKIVIYDFFAGSGTDPKGNLGSPLILLQESKGNEKSYCSQIDKPIDFIFNESLKRKAEKLKDAVKNYISSCEIDNGCRGCVYKTKIRNNLFKDGFNDAEVQNILQNDEYGKFILLDQYGFKEIDKQIFLGLVNASKTDFIFFISSSFINRFKEEPSTKAYINTENINFDESSPKDCHRIIAEYFRSLIPSNKEYYLHQFSIKKGANYYGLIFGTNHSLGMEKFLKVCWRKDELSGESNFNVDDDYELESLFYNPSNSNKKQKVKQQIKEKLFRQEITDNISGLKFTLQKGCLPILFNDVIKDLELIGKIKRLGDLNYASTNIHKIKKYGITMS
jgi:three-Cys-motif partner protein